MLQNNITSPQASSQPELSGNHLDLNKFNDWVNKQASISFQPTDESLQRLNASVDAVTNAVGDEKVIYGVTTGFGGMSNNTVGCAEAAALQKNLLSFLAAAAGPEIDKQHTRGAMLLRANVLMQGKSGVRPEIIQRLVNFCQADAIPVVRQFGSIGASGDLIPLATIARSVTGQAGNAKVRIGEQTLSVTEALKHLQLDPIQLRAKEGLALINGTSFSSAIAANATIAGKQGMALAMMVQSILMRALQVDLDPFQEFVHANKPHPGQLWSAQTIRSLLAGEYHQQRATSQVQDRYSLRCFPQYNGAIIEGFARIQQVVETEMNSVSDNPLVDPETGQFYQSGNFLGQYLGIAMDDLRRFIGLLAKHLDVQIASLVAPEFNGGLNASLRGNNDQVYNMGLKGLQICGNSIMPMLTYMGNPIVEHFPTHAEQFNQNINGLSWGAANLAWQSIQSFQQYLAVASIFAVQAIDLRAQQTCGHFDGRELLGAQNREFYTAVYERLNAQPGPEQPFLFNDSDRWLEQDIETLARDIADQDRLVDATQPTIDSFDQFFELNQ